MLRQVRADCEPSQLLDFLAGGSAAAASEAAEEAASNKAAEEELLDKVATFLLQSTPPQAQSSCHRSVSCLCPKDASINRQWCVCQGSLAAHRYR